MSEQKRKQRVSASFVTGAIALAFLIIGYQTALFVHRAATLKILSGATAPDTSGTGGEGDKDVHATYLRIIQV